MPAPGHASSERHAVRCWAGDVGQAQPGRLRPSPGAERQRQRGARHGSGYPAVLNAANEEAVKDFLAGEIPFSGVVRTVEAALAAFPGCGDDLDEILAADRWARGYVQDLSGSLRAQ